MNARFQLILLNVLLELWLQVLLSSTEMVEVPIIGRKTQRIVSRVTRGLRLHKRQSGRFTQHIKPAKEIDPIPEGPKVLMPRISPEDMKVFVNQAAETIRVRLESTEPSIYRSGAVQKPGTPEYYASATTRVKAIAKNYSRIALLAEEATRLISRSNQLSKEQVAYSLPTADIRGTLLNTACPLEVDFPCQPRKYRAFSGYCNNVQNPSWGNANRRFVRFLVPDYADSVSLPRQSANGGFLPSAREISLSVHTDTDRPHTHVTTILAIFGEFVFHDLAHIGQAAGYLGSRIKCCGVEKIQFHPECYPIRIHPSDPVFGRRSQNCMEYTRSSTAPRIGCTLGPREQINQVTSFLDGSVIYGSSVEEADSLRTFKGGELKTYRTSAGRELLPPDIEQSYCKSTGQSRCFLAGDARANENAGLIVLHTVWVREHNRIARALAELNPHWDDHEIFEEARRIVGAELQHITYKELLPAILGQDIVDKYDLQPQDSGHYTGYDININAGISNAVASAVFSFLFSMMPSHFELYSKDYKKLGSKPMSDTFFQPSDMYDSSKFNEYLLGLVTQKAQNRDEFITKEMTNNIPTDSSASAATDLAAFILQQGRDHGIPGYTQWRKFCRADPIINNFNDLKAVMASDTIEKLKRIYNNVHDIDLFTGGLAETPLNGAVTGPTFACLIGRQFHYLRRGDRFWYENDIPPSSFTKEQLIEIRKSTLARVLCDNADSADFMAPSAMYVSDPFLNAYQTCSSRDIPVMDLSKWKTQFPRFQVSARVLQDSLSRAKRQAAELMETERISVNKKNGLAGDKSPQAAHLSFLRPKRQAQLISNQSVVLEFASQNFAYNYRNQRDVEDGSSNSVRDLMAALPNVDVDDLLDIPKVFDCDDQTLPCDHTTKFRTMTGWCNNLNNPEWGKSMRIFSRLLPPAYADDMSAPRSKGRLGSVLPSGRVISTQVHFDVQAPHVRYSMMVMQWGQFLDHDITFTPMNSANGKPLDCSDCDSARSIHPECLPITIPTNDPFYPPINITTGRPTCISFVRSLSGQLTLGRREQLNQVTAFVDSSNVYGSDRCEARMLRTFVGGKLNVTKHPHGAKDLLPQTSNHKDCVAPSGLCFEAGDSRASEQPALAAIHTIFMREHNRMVSELQRINPHWSDEMLYQHGRRILSAINQHITYNEFTSRILGKSFANKYDLRPQVEGYYKGYDPTCDPTAFNEFAAAAFRFGHSLLKPAFDRLDRGYRVLSEPLHLRKSFFNSDMLFTPNAIDSILRGLATSSMENLDFAITEEVTNHLFEKKQVPFSGMDLAALNVQRARDHGIPGYNEYREFCNLTKAKSFDDLTKEIPPHIVERLKNVYNHVDDIDLFSGGLAERALHGGLVGPTFGCIIAKQFSLLKKCDRFYYETANPLLRFTEAQLTEIRKSSLAKVICDNSDSIDTIQRMVFDLPDAFMNPRVSCKSLPSVDLEQWKERVSCTVGKVTIDVGSADRISPCVMCTCTKEG
ncbi:Peroxidasin-like protein, partial [Stegodyphus mimosarum]